MNDSYIKNVIEAALLAAGAARCPLPSSRSCSTNQSRPTPTELRAALEQLDGRLRRPRHRSQGNRERVSASRCAGARARDFAPVARAAAALFARAARNARAHRLPPADHARRDRDGARRGGESRTSSRRCSSATGCGSSGIATCRAGRSCSARRRSSSTTSAEALEDLPPLAELKAMSDLNLQLPLPVTGGRRNAADGAARTRVKWRSCR